MVGIIYLVLLLLTLIAAGIDIATKKIPNWLVLVLTISGLSWNFFSAEGLGLGDSSAGLIIGLLLLLPGYVFASMGAGDVKLMAAIGSVVGFDKVLDVALYSYIVMMTMAIVLLIVKGDFVKLLLRYKVLLYGLFAGEWIYQKPEKSDAANYRLPLAPAFALSTFYVVYPDICNSLLMVGLCHFQN
jgi:prepilin peptidase CpaA